MVNLKMIRKARGMTQIDLAKAVNISLMSVHRYESGERVPNVDIASSIAAALGCTVDELINKDSAQGGPHE